MLVTFNISVNQIQEINKRPCCKKVKMKLYTSRSKLETYISVCQYKAALAYHLNETGISPKEYSIDLAFGTAFHLVVENILKGSLYAKSLNFGLEFLEQEKPKLIDQKCNNSDELFDYSFKEHKWLLQALTYAWYVSEWEVIKREYDIVSTEKEIENLFISSVCLASRLDALLYHKESQELHSYSLKTTKSLGYFSEAMQNRDLQGYLEIWNVEQWLSQANNIKQITLKTLETLLDKGSFAAISKFLEKRIPSLEKVSAVRFCFAVKGDRKEDKYNKLDESLKGYPIRHNPYIYGYRKVTTFPDGISGFDYAYSFTYFNNSNASGEGRLGKGWNKFPVAEGYPTGIEGWINNINNGSLQPLAENPIEKIIYVPEPIRRVEQFLEENVRMTQNAERELRLKVSDWDGFTANTKACTIPSKCEFLPICKYGGQFNQEEYDNMFLVNGKITSDLYQIRVPHHEPELNEFKKEGLI